MKLKTLRFILGALGYHHTAATRVLLKFSAISHTILTKVESQVYLRKAQSHKHKYKYNLGPQSGSLGGVLSQDPQSGSMSRIRVLSWGPKGPRYGTFRLSFSVCSNKICLKLENKPFSIFVHVANIIPYGNKLNVEFNFSNLFHLKL